MRATLVVFYMTQYSLKIVKINTLMQSLSSSEDINNYYVIVSSNSCVSIVFTVHPIVIESGTFAWGASKDDRPILRKYVLTIESFGLESFRF